MPLKHRLFLILALLTVVPFLILLFGVVDRIERNLEKRIEGELHATLDKMTSQVDELLNNQKSLALGLVRVPALKHFAEAAFTNDTSQYEKRSTDLESFFLNYQIVVPSIQALRFIDTKGKTLVKIKEGKEIPPAHLDKKMQRYYIADQSERSFFKWAIKGSQDVIMSDFELGQVGKNADFCPAMLRYSVPVRDELDTVQGLMVVNMWGTQIDKKVEASLGGYPGNVYIVELNSDKDRDGIYLYHNDSNIRFGNQTGKDYRFYHEVGEENWQKIKQISSDRGTLNRNGKDFIFYKKYKPYNNRSTQWLMVIKSPRESLFAPITSLKKTIWLFVGLLLAISLLVARWASNKLADPVNKLAATITRYADGDETARYAEKRTDEIGHAGEAFNYMCKNQERTRQERDKAEKAVQQSERLAAVGQLAAGVGHEINNPLMNIMSLVELLEQSLKDSSDKQVLNDLKTLKDEGQRCARVVQGILNFARASEPSYREFDMVKLIHDTVILIRHRLDSEDIQLEVDIPGTLIMEGDPNQLQQVLVNVLLNAIHASPRQGRIIIRTQQQGDDHIYLEVMDHGDGVSKSHINRVFNPFYTTKPEGKGTGLGLSVSYGIIEKHGGTITLDNRQDGGVIVRISLPVKAEQALDGNSESSIMEKKVAG